MKNRFALLVVFFAWCVSSQAAPVRVSGIAVNESHHRPAANVTLELVRAANGKSTPIAKVKTDAQGRFAFAPQEPGDSEFLLVRSRWQDYTYVVPAYDGKQQLQQMGIEVNPSKVRLAIYDTTHGLVPLAFSAHHLAIESREGGLKCVERIIVENSSRKTFLGMGERGATLLLNLPAGAKNVRLDENVTDAKLEKRPDGWAVIKPIPPQSYDPRVLVIIHYDMDWPSALPWERKINFSRKVQYPTKFFFVNRTTEDSKLEVNAPKLSKDQVEQLPIEGQMQDRIVNAVGQPSHMPGMAAVTGGDNKPALAAGDDLNIEVTSPVNPLFWGFLGFVVLLCLAIPMVLFKKGKPTAKAPAKIEEPKDTTGVNSGTFTPATASNGLTSSEKAQQLIEKIALLDEAFAKGAITEAEHTASRAALKSELLQQLSSQ